VLFAVNTGLRTDEAWRLEFRDVTVVDNEDLGKTILEIEVRGKRGVGYCKSMPGAVRPFERLRSRLRPARVYGVKTPTKTSMNLAAFTVTPSQGECSGFDMLLPERSPAVNSVPP
jgi:hypothetical protein